MMQVQHPPNLQNPHSVLRNGRFANKPVTVQQETYPISAGYDLQPLMVPEGRAPTNTTTRNTRTSRKVGFPSRNEEVTIRHTFASDPSPPRARKMKTKLATTGFGKSGIIKSRTGAAPLPLQRWSSSYWLHVYPATLKVFETEEKLNEWKRLRTISMSTSASASSSAYRNGVEDSKSENKLVLYSINFDSQGKLQRKIDSYQAKKERKHEGKRSEVATDSYDIKQNIANNLGLNHIKYVMEDVRSKYYSRKGPLMHTCKISYLSNTGRTIVAAFGSSEAVELKKLRSVIRYCIRLVRKTLKSKSRKHIFTDGGSSVFSGMTGGALSAISGTKYGEATMTERAAKRSKQRRSRNLPVD